jgi:SNF2 family DNA or RNA helicase
MNLTPYHSKYFACELTRRSPSDSIQKLATTLVDAQVDLNPHQVEAALFAFRSPLSMGAILADEVGLGKTIEAGLVISQKWAERKRSMLIIAPSSLRKQWSQELADKFFIPSVVLEAKAFSATIKGGNLNPFDQKDKIVICSFHFARNKDSYIKATQWDLVIIDEAHKLRNVYKPSNKIGKAIKEALADTPKILLTATPLQNSLLELFGLVGLIDDYAFGDLKSFKQQYSRLDEDAFFELKERLKPLCKRTLRRDVLEYIKYTNRLAVLQDYFSTDEEQLLYDLVSNYLQKPTLYALPASQRKLMTLILRKLLASSTFAISGTLQRLQSKLESIHLNNAGGENPIADLQTDYEAFDETEDEWFEEEGDEQPLLAEFETFAPDELEEIEAEISELRVMSGLAHSIKKNAKGEALLTALKVGFEKLEEQPGANRKAIIFTESRRTQEYLLELLERNGYTGEIVLFNGTNSDASSERIYRNWLKKHQGTDRVSGAKSADQRAALVEYFRDEATIMIATEAAAEGINLQFCSLLVNYDLPWNPQRIEQRIGRCHRYGQRFDVVVINFLNERNAADKRVYQLLNEKFHLFNGVFGASDEVLGSIESGVDFEKRIAEIYQTCRSEAEIQASFDALQREMDGNIQEQMTLTKQHLLDHFDEEVHEKLRISLEKSKEYLNKYETWLWQMTRQFLKGNATFSESGEFAFTLHQAPDGKIETGHYRIGKNLEGAHTYRIGHPLAQHIIYRCKNASLEPALLTFDYSGTRKIISILEPLVGKSGWLRACSLSIESFEPEDHILLAATTEEGARLDDEQCQRLFSLMAEEAALGSEISAKANDKVYQITAEIKQRILQESVERNSQFFDEEMDKLDHWADDVKNGLEIELKELEREIKYRKTGVRKILNLQEKVKEQRAIKDMEKRRSELRRNLYQAQDEVDGRKEKLIDNIEQRMQQKVNLTELFTIKWTLK